MISSIKLLFNHLADNKSEQLKANLCAAIHEDGAYHACFNDCKGCALKDEASIKLTKNHLNNKL